MRKIRYSAVAAAGLLALALAFPAYGKDKEEREPVGQISLRISSDIEAGLPFAADIKIFAKQSASVIPTFRNYSFINSNMLMNISAPLFHQNFYTSIILSCCEIRRKNSSHLTHYFLFYNAYR